MTVSFLYQNAPHCPDKNMDKRFEPLPEWLKLKQNKIKQNPTIWSAARDEEQLDSQILLVGVWNGTAFKNGCL